MMTELRFMLVWLALGGCAPKLTPCAAHESDAAAQQCLPRCAADTDCGLGFACLQAACVARVRPDAGPAATDSGAKPRDAGADSAPPDASDPPTSKLEQSRAAWNALVAAMGDTYSYTEENCLVNAPMHELTTVQVENGKARLVTTFMITSKQCLALVNRYASFQPRTLPELYDECAALIARECSAVKVELDERGVIRGCTWPGASDCSDNCGEGFYRRAVQFGTLILP
jgi:hypothetical protein